MTTKTYRLRGRDIEREWRVIDAAGRPLGRLAGEVARLLLGKHKPDYEPHLPMGDHVIVINAADVVLTGRKAEQKVYYRHSGYPGGLRTRSFQQQMDRDPTRVIETAVRGMLPHNALGRELFRHLKVYAGDQHPHEAQLKAGSGARARRRASAADRSATPAATAPSADEVEEAVAAAPEAAEAAEATDVSEASEVVEAVETTADQEGAAEATASDDAAEASDDARADEASATDEGADGDGDAAAETEEEDADAEESDSDDESTKED